MSDKPGRMVEIRVLAAEGSAKKKYPVELRVVGGPHVSGTLQLSLQDLNGRPDPEDYGRALGRGLLPEGEVRDKFDEALAAARAVDDRLHVRLQIDPPELQQV